MKSSEKIVPELSIQYWYLLFALSKDHPTNKLFMEILKKFLDPPELNCSNVLSLYCLRVSKKIYHFLQNLVRRERRFSWFNVNPLSFIHRNDAWHINRFSSLWFAFAFDLAAKTFTIDCDACSSGNCKTFCVVIVWINHNLFDPWKILTQDWVLSSFGDQNLISTPYLAYKQLVVTSNTGPIFVFPWIRPFRLWWSVVSWKSVFTTSLCIKLFSIIFSHEILSNLNNMYKSCIQTEFTHFVFLWKQFDSLFISLQ